MRRLIASIGLLAGLVTAAPAQQPIITDVAWFQISSYCTFLRAGQNFDYNDSESWRFVFFDNFDTITGSNARYAYIGIHHQLRQLEELSRDEFDAGEKRAYKTYGEPAYTVDVVMNKGEDGGESSAYTGTIVVKGGDGEEQIEFHGDCGV